MAKKKMPIDVKKVIEAMGSIGEQRDLPVFIDIVYDCTASDELIAMVQRAFATREENALIENIVLGMQSIELPTPADLCVIVAGTSLAVGAVASQARSKGIPAVVVCEKGGAVFTSSQPGVGERQGAKAEQAALVPVCGIPVADLIELDPASTAARPLDALGTWIVANAPAKRMSMAADFAFMRHPMAIESIIGNSIQNGAISIVFFMPGADMPAITLNQARMVLELAAIYGQPLDMKRAKELAVVVAGAFGLRGLARAVVRQVPGPLGIPAKAAISASGTVVMGYAAIDYFEQGGVLATIAEKSEDAYRQAEKLARKVLTKS